MEKEQETNDNSSGETAENTEAKNQEKLNIWKSLEQSETNSGNHTPIVIFKRNRTKTYVALEFDKLLELLNE
mgnify:CR=1 FL=1